jgi:hypothetical protein
MEFRTILLSNAGLIFIGSNVAKQSKAKVFVSEESISVLI